MFRRLAIMLIFSAVLSAAGEVMVLTPARDNTLYESLTGGLSNGSGAYFLAGRTGQASGPIRRGLIAFDVAGAIPAGVSIVSATLTLHMSLTIAGPRDMSLHRVRSSWGEAGSDAPGQEGAGTSASPGDATWLHRFSPVDLWTVPGGDYEPDCSASTSVAAAGYYSWGPSSALRSDVQGWVDDPSANHGWLILGDESIGSTAKRFDSRENPDPAVRPELIIFYAPELPGDVDCDADVDTDDVPLFVIALIDSSAFAGCDVRRADVNGDTAVDGRDVGAIVSLLCP